MCWISAIVFSQWCFLIDVLVPLMCPYLLLFLCALRSLLAASLRCIPSKASLNGGFHTRGYPKMEGL